jgi:hypothetical protein
MPTTLNPTCPLCGLRYTGRPLLELHLREDHHPRESRAEPDPGACEALSRERRVSGHGDGVAGGG